MDMDITPFYISLRKAVEETIGRPMKTPNDFLWLKEKLQDQLGETLSLATLERFWGYAKTPYRPSRWTLNVLSAYVGSTDFERFCYNTEEDVSSGFLDRERLSVETLAIGKCVRLTWKPGHRCVVKHLGEGLFRIQEASGTKLSVGDTFICHAFIQDEPLYLSELKHEGMSPVSYVAGKKNGVKFMVL